MYDLFFFLVENLMPVINKWEQNLLTVKNSPILGKIVSINYIVIENNNTTLWDKADN